MSALGGIGQQVAGDLFELGKSVVKSTVKVVGDTATDSIEQILGAPVGIGNNEKANSKTERPDRNKENEVLIKRREEKKQFNEVRSQLAEYVERKKQQDAQIARERAEQKQVADQKRGYEKQKKESFLQQLMSKLSRGSHGETERQKE